MWAIITRPNADGTYDECGMNNKTLRKEYKTVRGLLKYGIPNHFKGRIRIEIFSGHDSFLRNESQPRVLYTYR